MVWLRLRHWNIFIEIKPEVADMIEKMKFLSITGPKADIDRVVNQYLANYNILPAYQVSVPDNAFYRP